MSLKNLSETAASNTSIGGVNVAELTAMSNLNNGIRALAADVKDGLAGATDTVSSGATTDLGSVDSLYVSVTGSTGPITSFGTVTEGIWKIVQFASTPTVTHNGTSLIIPGGANITVAANDVWICRSLGSGNWRVINIQPAAGPPITSVSGGGYASGGAFVVGVPRVSTLTSGSGSFVKNSSTTWMRVRGVGGGAGSGGSGGAGATSGGNGGTTTFDNATAAGGTGGGSSASPSGGAGGSASNGQVNFTGAAGSNGNNVVNGSSGGNGGQSVFGGGGAGGNGGNAGGSSATNSGSGAGGAGGPGSGGSAGGGGAGAYFERIYLQSSLTTSFSYSIGVAGTAGSAGSGGSAGAAGAAGILIVEEYY